MSRSSAGRTPVLRALLCTMTTVSGIDGLATRAEADEPAIAWSVTPRLRHALYSEVQSKNLGAKVLSIQDSSGPAAGIDITGSFVGTPWSFRGSGEYGQGTTSFAWDQAPPLAASGEIDFKRVFVAGDAIYRLPGSPVSVFAGLGYSELRLDGKVLEKNFPVPLFRVTNSDRIEDVQRLVTIRAGGLMEATIDDENRQHLFGEASIGGGAYLYSLKDAAPGEDGGVTCGTYTFNVVAGYGYDLADGISARIEYRAEGAYIMRFEEIVVVHGPEIALRIEF